MADAYLAKRLRTEAGFAAPPSDNECRRYLTAEGCPFGDTCRYRHGAADTRDLNPPAANSNIKACTKFFSTSGCPYGEGCHFNHYVPGGITALGLAPGRPSGTPVGPSSGKPPNVCRRLTQPGGCRFGSQCHFSHPGETTLAGPCPPQPWTGAGGLMDGMGGGMDGRFGRPEFGGFGDPMGLGAFGGRREGGDSSLVFEPVSPNRGGGGTNSTFGAVSTAKISVEAALVGAIIGKGGSNVKYIVKQSGAKVQVRDHESDASKKTVEMEGSLEQIEYAARLVRQFLSDKSAAPPSLGPGPGAGRGRASLGSHNYKTKLCENFSQGSCSFGMRCHFAHGRAELREPGAGGAPPPNM